MRRSACTRRRRTTPPSSVACVDDRPEDVERLLGKATEALPAAEVRSGQVQMAKAVARAVKLERHLVVQAGTGTGKSLAYLTPLVLSGGTSVVATATKNLQDQLAGGDLPLLQRALGEAHPFRFAVLKGRGNYLCRQRLVELRSGHAGAAEDLGEKTDAPGVLFDVPGADADEDDEKPRAAVPGLAEQLRRLLAWAEHTPTGDRDGLDFEPDRRAWDAVSTTARECPGAYRCPSGPDCFAELARTMAASADVVVVNSHLYAAHLASGGSVLPPHDVVVFDEAHATEDVMTEGLGVELTPGRLRAAAASAGALLDQGERTVAEAVSESGHRLDAVLAGSVGRRVLLLEGTGDDELRQVLTQAGARVGALVAALRRHGASSGEPPSEPLEVSTRRTRALLAASHLSEELAALIDLGPDRVAWVEGGGPGGSRRSLRAAPVEVGPVLAERLWPDVTAVLTSATIPPFGARRLGLPGADTDHLDVGSPFPYEDNALLYCPVALPDRRSDGAEPAIHRELALLMEAAGGRTLALFTSWRAMRNAVEALRPTVTFPVLAQNDLPKPALVKAFASEESACLFATMSFWQGVDVPGPTLSLVAVDRLPFPRPDDPLLQARRERAGARAFAEVDLPRAATLLAQGAGRLIRSSTDRGVVAVLDRRLATAGYRTELLSLLPPMPFTTDRRRAIEFLHAVAASAPVP